MRQQGSSQQGLRQVTTLIDHLSPAADITNFLRCVLFHNMCGIYNAVMLIYLIIILPSKCNSHQLKEILPREKVDGLISPWLN